MASIRQLCGLPRHAVSAIALLICAAVCAPDALAAPKQCRGNPRQTGDCANTGNNLPPVISGTAPGHATVGEPYAFAPAASDPEGARLSFTIANKPPWATFSASSGRLSGTPTTAAVGVHVDIVIRVSDGRQTAELAPFAIEVRPGNAAPTIVGAPPTAAREGQAYDFRPAAADANGDPLTFTIANRPSWASFNAGTGRLSGTPAAGSVGVYANVTIRVSDGRLVATLPAFSIAVQQASLGSATLSWVAPTTRVDGSPLGNLAGYRIRYGTAPGSYPNQVEIPNPGITSFVIENLPAGTYFFVVVAYDATGLESEHSAAASKTIS